MGLRLQTNIPSMRAAQYVESNHTHWGKSMERLASGQRIISSADDASGLSIGFKMTARARAMSQAIRNAEDGISVVQTSEGALQAVGDILIRFRELGIQASSDTVSDLERGMLNREVLQLRAEIDRVARSTEFNGRKLLDGNPSNPRMEIQVGVDQDAATGRFGFDSRDANAMLSHLGLESIDFSSKESARNHLTKIDRAINEVAGHRAALGALQNGMESGVRNMGYSRESTLASRSRIMDTDIAQETAESTRSQIGAQAAMSVLTQANQAPTVALKLI